MIYHRRLLDIFSRFLFTVYRGVKFAIFHILREWLLTQRSALPCIRVICLETVLEGSDGVRWPDVDWQAVPRLRLHPLAISSTTFLLNMQRTQSTLLHSTEGKIQKGFRFALKKKHTKRLCVWATGPAGLCRCDRQTDRQTDGVWEQPLWSGRGLELRVAAICIPTGLSRRLFDWV